ncbi:MAG: efflux transporter periplasmic adaptor subunit [Crocinitomicaceae bacterium]|nr:efflux transporter periplasmic adaptor subunit [Crocinitomicaceae bacterium]|tara:strand:- start:6982 stop:8220 length:1239 start_codon:yes stop_codon:yes gene_type:complete
MKTINKVLIALTCISYLLAGCGQHNHDEHSHSEEHGHEHAEEDGHSHAEGHHHNEEHVVYFSQQQFDAFEIEVDTLPLRNLSSYVEANGRLEVPPQNEASVTTTIGANIVSIEVIEGDKVAKGQVLAKISHPDLIELQTDYINAWNQLKFLEKDYQRQKKLYEEKVGSGKEFQKTSADYLSTKGMVNGYEAQLKLLGLSIDKLKESEVYEQVLVTSPINGYIRAVEVKLGQYVQPQKALFEVVNIDHIHADLMVYEKDISKVKEGQKVKFSVESESDSELEAVIYSVGRAFEEDPKAIHLHAEIENKEGVLLPGMYVEGRILTDDAMVLAIPEEAVVREGDQFIVFTAEMHKNKADMPVWKFTPMEVRVGVKDQGWLEVKLVSPLKEGAQFAMNNAYYLISELKKEEAEHSH